MKRQKLAFILSLILLTSCISNKDPSDVVSNNNSSDNPTSNVSSNGTNEPSSNGGNSSVDAPSSNSSSSVIEPSSSGSSTGSSSSSSSSSSGGNSSITPSTPSSDTINVSLLEFYNDMYAAFVFSSEADYNRAFGDNFSYIMVNGQEAWLDKVGPIGNNQWRFNVQVPVELYDTNSEINLSWVDKQGNVFLTATYNKGGQPSTPDKPDVPDTPDTPDKPDNPDKPSIPTTDVEGKFTPKSIEGADNVTVAKGHYFDAFSGVKAYSDTNTDVTSYLQVSGNVNYGKEGTYSLKYSLKGNGQEVTKVRTVTVSSMGYAESSYSINKKDNVNTLGSGSYVSNDVVINDENFSHPNTPNGVKWNTNEKKVPTNSWFSGLFANSTNTGLMINNYRSVVKGNSISLSKIGQGGIETYQVAKDTMTGLNATTMSNFTPTFNDLLITSSSLQSGCNTNILSYSDNNVKVALNNGTADQMVLTYTQGSPFVFFETNGEMNLNIQVDNNGVTNGYSYYRLNGQEIKSAYQGSSIIVKMSGRHCGYDSTYPNSGVGGAKYNDYYFLITGSENTKFTPKHTSHPDKTKLDGLEISNTSENYLSIAPIEAMSDAVLYAQFASNMINASYSYYSVNHEQSKVTTTHLFNTQNLNSSEESRPLVALMPHQYKLCSGYSYVGSNVPSMRGNLKLYPSSMVSYADTFNGVLPSFTLPTNSEFSADKLKEYLTQLDNNCVSDGVFVKDSRDYLDDPAPYWNAKAVYPLANGVIMASQINATELKNSFLNKIEALLSDWFTYSGGDDQRFLYYNSTWGSTYYSNNEFSTASRLSDHHFTHGYLVYASAVAMMYDNIFYNKYKDIVDFFLADYMNYDRSNTDYPYLRSFDTWAGHSWADGLGDFMDGNNQESCGEALNSWVAGYMFGLATNNQQLIDAAIYGYTTELMAIKQYWFNYDEDNWSQELSATGIHALAIVWGAKNEYQTWFGPNPEFIYGIHWLPIGEYLSSYALGTKHKNKLNDIYNAFLRARGGAPKCWFSNMWCIQSLVDANAALSHFNENTLKNDEYPNDLALTYYMINAMKSLGNHDDASYATVCDSVATSVYNNNGQYYALVWNTSSKRNVVVNYNGTSKTIEVPANGFYRIAL